MNNKVSHVLNAYQQHWPEVYEPQVLPLRLTLLQANVLHESRTNEVLDAFGLSLVEFSVLASLRRSPPPYALTPSEIQRSMLITSGGLTKVLVQLEAKGLVTRSTQDTDRRVKPVALTAKALEVLEGVMAELDAKVNGWLSELLTGEEVGQLTKLLSKLLEPEN